ncbi:hypothetical protein EmuJ_000076300 [Echinococcus multilocularis]|uniref:Uncharacterized protein n=1 Tax=Echinococcus multilocularis TaxID=6211 RepID=A0A087VXS4_ECHMU|nr:hypothetical protein EmuJ_000076300 [Echinococcus multilocularis]
MLLLRPAKQITGILGFTGPVLLKAIRKKTSSFSLKAFWTSEKISDRIIMLRNGSTLWPLRWETVTVRI